MTAPIVAEPSTAPVPWRQLAPWLVFASAMAFFVLYFILAEQGATALVGGRMVHEFVHDARHILGVPCH